MTEYTYEDPTKSDKYPRITEGEVEVEWPENWGTEPTERDQAVVNQDGN